MTGSIRLGCCEERVKELKYQLSRQGWHQAPMRLVGPDEIQEMVPILNMDEVNRPELVFTFFFRFLNRKTIPSNKGDTKIALNTHIICTSLEDQGVTLKYYYANKKKTRKTIWPSIPLSLGLILTMRGSRVSG